jgi:hypothetical protein
MPHSLGKLCWRTIPINFFHHEQVGGVNVDALRAAEKGQFAAIRVSPDDVVGTCVARVTRWIVQPRAL